MSTSTAFARQRYATESVSTASPARLLIMLYDRLVRDLIAGEQALSAGDRSTANAELQHAQQILLELNTSLDAEAWEGGPGLSALYLFCWQELVAANIGADAARVRGVREVLEPLRDAWREAALSLLAP